MIIWRGLSLIKGLEMDPWLYFLQGPASHHFRVPYHNKKNVVFFMPEDVVPLLTATVSSGHFMYFTTRHKERRTRESAACTPFSVALCFSWGRCHGGGLSDSLIEKRFSVQWDCAPFLSLSCMLRQPMVSEIACKHLSKAS